MTNIAILIAALFITSASSQSSNPLAAKASEIGCVRTSTGTDYVGSQNVSSSGRPCVRWDSLVGAFRDHIKMLFVTMPERNAAKAQNFCRNPNTDTRGLWCFVSQLGTVQFCSVPKCATFGSTSTTTSTTSSTPAVPSTRSRRTNGRHLATTTERTSSLLRNDIESPPSSWSQNEDDNEFTDISAANEDRGYEVSPRDSMQNDEAPDETFADAKELYGDGSDPYQTPSNLSEERRLSDDWSSSERVVKSDDGMAINFRDSAASFKPSSLLLSAGLLILFALLL